MKGSAKGGGMEGATCVTRVGAALGAPTV